MIVSAGAKKKHQADLTHRAALQIRATAGIFQPLFDPDVCPAAASF